MTLTEAILVLDTHNRWRNGEKKISMTNPKDVTEALNIAVHQLRQLNKTKPNKT